MSGHDEETRRRDPRLGSVEEALTALREGRPVLVLDDVDRENEGDVVVAAQTLTEAWTAWMIRHGSGYVCAPMPPEWADRLDLPVMVADNEDSLRTTYTITCDAREGVTTGISAADRAHTIRVLGDPTSLPSDLIRPGHVVPLRARAGGVLERRGHTEATVDLCRLAGLAPVGAIAELMHDDGTMMRTDAVLDLGREAGVPVITIDALVEYRRRHDRVLRVADTRLPTTDGEFRAIGYRDLVTGAEHVALVSPRGLHAGEDTDGPVLVRVHSECLTGDAFGSLRCDCGPQLRASRELVAREGGVVVYLRGHEGRGVGLLHKLQAYELQDAGRDTVDAQVELGLPVDAREYGAAAAVLRDLGVEQVTLLTNNPDKVEDLRAAGFDRVTPRPLQVGLGPDNVRYLSTKATRMRHDLPLEEFAAVAASATPASSAASPESATVTPLNPPTPSTPSTMVGHITKEKP